MDRLETYSHECGVKPADSPHDFPTVFFPLPEKYITVCSASGIQGKDYRFFDLVFFILSPILQQKNIAVIHLCEGDEPGLPNTFRLNIPLRQKAHAIKHALCHLTVENASAHLAGAFETPLVELLADRSSLTETPHYKGAYLPLEGNLNELMPEKVANAVLELLGLPPVSFSTVHIGSHYNQLCVDLIPNFVPDFAKLPANLIIRMDQHHDENFLMHALMSRQQTSFIFKKPLQIQIPLDKVGYMVFIFDDNYDADYIRGLDIGKTILVYDGPKENLPRIRMDLESPFNCGVVHHIAPIELSNVSEESRFTSKRIFLSGGMEYGSLENVKKGVPGVNMIPVGKALHSKDFTDYANYYFIYDLKTT